MATGASRNVTRRRLDIRIGSISTRHSHAAQVQSRTGNEASKVPCGSHSFPLH